MEFTKAEFKLLRKIKTRQLLAMIGLGLYGIVITITGVLSLFFYEESVHPWIAYGCIATGLTSALFSFMVMEMALFWTGLVLLFHKGTNAWLLLGLAQSLAATPEKTLAPFMGVAFWGAVNIYLLIRFTKVLDKYERLEKKKAKKAEG